MRKSSKVQNRLRVMAGMLMLFAVMAVGLGLFSITSRADSAGKVTATSAKIRKEPSTSSETLASLEQNDAVNIKGQVKGSDGYTWYQVDDSNLTGYIRSDLVSITDGSTPATIVSSTTTSTSSTPTTSTPDETLVEVTPVEPVSGKVSGGSPVRVRQNASTTSRIVSKVQNGLELTVIGTATGTDGQDWRYVSFNSAGSAVTGFIRADYISVSGDLVPAGTGIETPEIEQPEDTNPEPVQTKDWDTFHEGGKWHLLDNASGNTYDIEQIFDSVEANKKILDDTIKSNKTQQVIVVILCIIMVVMAAVISFLIFKLKDMADAEYFNEVERETARRRTADRPAERSQGRQKPTQGGGPEGRRPTGQRPAGAGGSSQRPAGQRPAGGSGQRPAGQRPAGAGGNGQRPAGQRPAGAGGSGQRPAGQRPVSANEDRPRPVDGSGQRPVKRQPEYEQDLMESQQKQDYTSEREPAYGQDVAPEVPVREKAPAQSNGKEGRKARNFANDDDFEFQFLDWDGDDRK